MANIFTINNFISELDRREGPYRPNLFLLEITPPNWVANPSSLPPTLSFFCQDVNLPGVTITPIDVRRQGLGPVDRRPTNVVFPDINPTFLLDNQGVILTFFQAWMNNTVNFNTRKGELSQIDEGYPFEVYYQDRYICNKMTIKTFDPQEDIIHEQTFYEAWPYQIGDVTLNWNETDSFGRLTVGFYYRNWTSRSLKLTESDGELNFGTEGKESTTGGRQLSTTERLLQIATAGLALNASIKKPQHIGDYINAARNLKLFKDATLGNVGG